MAVGVDSNAVRRPNHYSTPSHTLVPLERDSLFHVLRFIFHVVPPPKKKNSNQNIRQNWLNCHFAFVTQFYPLVVHAFRCPKDEQIWKRCGLLKCISLALIGYNFQIGFYIVFHELNFDWKRIIAAFRVHLLTGNWKFRQSKNNKQPRQQQKQPKHLQKIKSKRKIVEGVFNNCIPFTGLVY